MTDKTDTKLLQVLLRQARQDPLVISFSRNAASYLFEAKPPQPTSDVHGGTPVRTVPHDPPGEIACLGSRSLNDRIGSCVTSSAGPHGDAQLYWR